MPFIVRYIHSCKYIASFFQCVDNISSKVTVSTKISFHPFLICIESSIVERDQNKRERFIKGWFLYRDTCATRAKKGFKRQWSTELFKGPRHAIRAVVVISVNSDKGLGENCNCWKRGEIYRRRFSDSN